MRGVTGQRRAFTYKVTVPPGVLPVSLDDFKKHIKATDIEDDAMLTIYLEAAVTFCEQFTRRDLITRTYETFRDVFPTYRYGYPASGNVGFEIRKSPLQSIEKIEYLKDSVKVEVDSSIYYNTIETDYSEVLTLGGNSWPTDVDERLQAIIITFKSGIGDADTDIPSCYKDAIMNHAAAMWANRGECDDISNPSDVLAAVPAASMVLYKQKRIHNL